MAADGDAAALRIIKPGKQAANRRFSRTGRTDNGGRGLFGNRKADIFQNRARIIAERDILKFDIIVRQLNILAIRINQAFALQGVKLIHRVINHAERVRAVAERFKTCENAEREEHEQQHNRKIHLTGKAHEHGR